MNLRPLSLAQIEEMYQDGALSEFERIDLVERWVARQKKAMNLRPLSIAQIVEMYQDGALSEFERIDLVERWVARQKKAMNAASAAAPGTSSRSPASKPSLTKPNQ